MNATDVFGEVKEWLVPLGYIAGLMIVGLSVARGVRAMMRMSNAVVDLEKKFQGMWLAAEQIGSARPALVQDLVGYETWDTSLVRGLMKTAKERIYVMQTWFPEKEGDLDRWELTHLDTLSVRILMAGAKNPAVHERVRYRQDSPTEKTEEALGGIIESNVGSCVLRLKTLFDQCKLKEPRFDSTIALYEKGMPFGPVYVIDDVLLVGYYPAHLNCNAAPMFRMSAASRTGRTFIEAMDAVFQDAAVVYPAPPD